MPNNDLNSDAKYVLLACVQEVGAVATTALTSLGNAFKSFPADGPNTFHTEKLGNDDRTRYVAIYDPNNSEGGNGGGGDGRGSAVGEFLAARGSQHRWSFWNFRKAPKNTESAHSNNYFETYTNPLPKFPYPLKFEVCRVFDSLGGATDYLRSAEGQQLLSAFVYVELVRVSEAA